MATNLSTLVEPLQRELAVPGEFDTYFPDTDEDGLIGTLSDAFAECQLDGFFGTQTLDLETFDVSPDLSLPGGALVVLYAASRTIRARMRSMNSTERYKAGPVEFETGKAASMMTAELKLIQDTKDRLIAQGKKSGAMDYVFDGYFSRASVQWSNLAVERSSGFFAYELAG
jgi:hypothetical protein